MSSVVKFRDKEEFKRGRNGEQLSAAWLQSSGWYVIPSYDFAGEDGDKAPKMMGPLAGYVLPDLDVCRDGKRFWCEVKTKDEPTFTRITGQHEHGMSLRLFRQYKQVERHTGNKVFVFVYEEKSRWLLCRPLGEEKGPGVRIYNGERMGPGGMIFWPRFSFREVHRFPEDEAEE